MVKFVFAAAVCTVVLFGCASNNKKLSMYGQRLENSNVSERRAAAQQLRVEPRNPKLIPVILQACGDPDADVRVNGFYALAKVNPAAEGVVPAMFNGLADTVTDVRRAAVSALSEFNPFPNVCLPPMVKLLVDPDEMVRKLAHTAFIDLQGLGVGSLIRYAGDKDADLRLAVVVTLGAIGPQAKTALTRLKTVSQEDEDEQVKEAAQNAIVMIETGKSGERVTMPERKRTAPAEKTEEAVTAPDEDEAAESESEEVEETKESEIPQKDLNDW